MQSKNVVILDYGCGNVKSVYNAFRVLDYPVKISNRDSDIQAASHLVLPGVGAFERCRKGLADLGLLEILQREVLENGKPFLGICVGMQILAKVGFEFGHHEGLGWIPGRVEKIDVSHSGLRLPHIGWNEVQIKTPDPLFRGIYDRTTFYFVHSYQFIAENPAWVSSTCQYGLQVTASIQKENIFGVQFHPEKSQSAGIRLIKNFLEIKT